MTSVIVFGRDYRLHRNLTAEELSWLDANLNLYKKLMFTITRKCFVGARKPSGWTGNVDVVLVKDGKDARLCARRDGGSMRWDG